MPIRGIRGATTAAADEPELILEATRELLEEILAENSDMRPEDIASAFFTVTDDLASTFPAQAARQMGWDLVPMLCAREIPVPGSLPRVIRVLVHWNTEVLQSEVTHVYLRDAVRLRPDLVSAQ
ncbi:MAG: chorismate mutase [Chloroflexi bacterium]|nr:chorismate mutase [Chloroflexota bacterium]MDL1942855.1 chorismate mutase [Chloroflexi bacterium CFX2]